MLNKLNFSDNYSSKYYLNTMKLWIGGILEADIADSFRELRNDLEKRVNHLLESKQYGEGLSTWDLSIAITSCPPNEHVKYNKKSSKTDCSLAIDHQTFTVSDTQKREQLLTQTILLSIQQLSLKNIPDFDFNELRQDVVKALAINDHYAL
jgi:hypothetical protein